MGDAHKRSGVEVLVLARTGLASVFIMGSAVMACKLKKFRKLIGLYAGTSEP